MPLDPSIFAQFLREPKSVADYDAEAQQRESRTHRKHDQDHLVRLIGTQWCAQAVLEVVALGGEVDQHVAQQHDVEGPDVLDRQAQVELAELHALAQLVLDLHQAFRIAFAAQAVLLEAAGIDVAQAFLRRAGEVNLHLPLYGLCSTDPKPIRIRQLGPYLAQRRLRVRNTPGGRMLELLMV